MKAAEILCPKKQQLLKDISLSANKITDRVNDLTEYIQCQLKENHEYSVAYSLATDRSTDAIHIAELPFNPVCQ
jgi:hypothetical protein